MLISDFQRSGWSGSEEVRFPEGMTVTTVSVASPDTANLAVPSVTFARASFSGQERVTVTAGLSNKGDEPLKDVPVTLTIDGHEIRDREGDGRAARVGLGRRFTQFTLATAERARHGARRDPIRCRPTTRFISSSRRASRCRSSSSTAATVRTSSLFLAESARRSGRRRRSRST